MILVIGHPLQCFKCSVSSLCCLPPQDDRHEQPFERVQYDGQQPGVGVPSEPGAAHAGQQLLHRSHLHLQEHQRAG